MSRLGEVHDHQGDSGSQTCCEPLESWVRIVLQVELEDSCDNDTDQSAEEMAKDQRTWLRKRYIDGTITKDRRGALSLR